MCWGYSVMNAVVLTTFSTLLENMRNQINEVFMGRICSIFGRDTCKIKGTYAYSLEDLGLDGRIILSRIIN
jgi:hypothetical protein